MAKQEEYVLCILIVLAANVALRVTAVTDPPDVLALVDQYRALNNPPQLKRWRLDGGDPCGESWLGVSCFGSSVIRLKLQGLNLSGYLGSQFHLLYGLRQMDLSYNNIAGEIPYSLPPNVTHLNLACNNLEQNIPHSLPSFELLRVLNLSHNVLSGPIGNVFSGLLNLREMDLSYNNFAGDLPSSFGSLKHLSRLLLQKNQFTGSVALLEDLPLIDLNIQSNNFNGSIPSSFQRIPNLWMDGNHFHLAPGYPPWSFPMENFTTITQNLSTRPVTESRAVVKSHPATAVQSQPALGVAKHKKRLLSLRGVVVGLIIGASIFISILKRKFSEDHLLGEGSLGSVCRAEFPDGQVAAVNVDSVEVTHGHGSTIVGLELDQYKVGLILGDGRSSYEDGTILKNNFKKVYHLANRYLIGQAGHVKVGKRIREHLENNIDEIMNAGKSFYFQTLYIAKVMQDQFATYILEISPDERACCFHAIIVGVDEDEGVILLEHNGLRLVRSTNYAFSGVPFVEDELCKFDLFTPPVQAMELAFRAVFTGALSHPASGGDFSGWVIRNGEVEELSFGIKDIEEYFKKTLPNFPRTSLKDFKLKKSTTILLPHSEEEITSFLKKNKGAPAVKKRKLEDGLLSSSGISSKELKESASFHINENESL